MNTSKKRLFINMIASIFSFSTSTLIVFFITPIIVNSISAEAYGFVGLSNNFVSYFSLITLAISSMASRFIIISLQTNNEEMANKYFSSSFLASLGIIVAMVPVAFVFIFYIDKIINIDPSITLDVQFLFACTFTAFFVSVLGSTFSIAVTAQNKLYLRSIRDIISNVCRIFLLFFLFYFFKPSVYFMGLSVLISNSISMIIDIFYANKILPNIMVKKQNFDFGAVKELFFSGMWNSVASISQMLLVGFDLLLANVFLGGNEMGVLAVSKTAPGFLTSYIYILFPLFIPKFMKLYSQKKNDELIEEIKLDNNILNIFVCIPISILFTFGKDFYNLWVPTQNIDQLVMLTNIILIGYVFNIGVTNMYSVFEFTNKIKFNAISLLISGMCNVVIVTLLLKNTNWGIYAIAGVSVVLGILRDSTVLPLYGAKCLNQKWYVFYPSILKACTTVVILTLTFNSIKFYFYNNNNWINLIIICIMCGLIGLFMSILVNFNFKLKSLYKKIKL